jgi:hypothetical protein
MNKKSFVFLFSIFLFGCKPYFENDEKVESDKLKWATVDQHQIKEKLSRLILQDNPYPEDIYYDKSMMSNRLKALKNIKRQEEIKCLFPDSSNTDKTTGYSSSNYFNIGKQLLDPNCLSQKEISELLSSLNKQISEQQELIDRRASFDRKIEDMANVASIKAIENYSKDKFDLILDTRRNTIIYNRGGVSLDVTGSVIEYYENSQSQ